MTAADVPSAPAVQPQPDAVVRAARAGVLASLLGLITLGLVWELWLAPTGSGTLAIKVLPLALGLPGVLRHRMHTYRWLSLLVWLYVAEGVVRSTTEAGAARALAVAEIALCLLLFTAATVYIRRRLRRPAPAAA